MLPCGRRRDVCTAEHGRQHVCGCGDRHRALDVFGPDHSQIHVVPLYTSGSNLGSAIPSAIFSNTTLTCMPISTASGAQPTSVVTICTPSLKSTTARMMGICSANAGWLGRHTTAKEDTV